jgi:hypothetical protein
VLDEQLAEPGPSHVLHDNKWSAAMFAGLEHADGIAMSEARAGECLDAKPPLDVRISR